MGKIKIVLADDHTLFRQGIRTLIAGEPDMEVVAEAANGGDVVEKVAEVLAGSGADGYRHARPEQLRGNTADQEESP